MDVFDGAIFDSALFDAGAVEGPFTRGYIGPQQKKKKRKQIRDELREAIYGLEHVPTARPVLEKIVTPFVSKRIERAEPLPAIDFAALMKDLEAVSKLMAAYESHLREEDEDEDLLMVH